ncbi:hypothetical protein BKA62DRAFT_641591 [Auriculariales sp. MPI-PUGE-AT-0066]|nr:hypothetical protein BKA62DRAFT_641591 [Auriculariales sp. MPI-PUGE-AT-0066]
MPHTFQTPLGPGFAFGPFPAGGITPELRRPSSTTPRKWCCPEAQGRTLRQRVEEHERQLGLRCDSVSCDIAPTDEDPTPVVPAGVTMRTVKLQHPHGEPSGKHCEHLFHPQCLVTHARVTNANPGAVSCPLCRVEVWLRLRTGRKASASYRPSLSSLRLHNIASYRDHSFSMHS